MDITVRPGAYRQFGGPRRIFCLVVDPERAARFRIADDGAYERTLLLVLPPGADLSDLLTEQVPDGAHVVVVCPDRFLASPPDDAVGGRQLAVLPAGSTSLTWEQLRHFLAAAERVDADRQGKAAQSFFEAVERSEHLRLVDRKHGTEAVFRHGAGDYAWNQQAGRMEPGDQQILPAGELSVLPVDITGFDPDARLAVDGTLTLRGWPIVHRYHRSDTDAQRDAFAALSGLAGQPVVLHLAGGVIERHEPVTAGGRPVADTLGDLFAEEPRYRTLWEVGFGINTELDLLPANCGPNEVFGGADGVLHLGLGLTPTTRFALTFSCPDSSVLTPDAEVLLGSRAPAGRGRLARTSSASCGCH